MDKKELGAFYTSRVDEILKQYIPLIKGKDIVDPMAGDNHLLNWAAYEDCSSIEGFDINPLTPNGTKNTLLGDMDYSNKFILANPPYLLNNKAKDKTPFKYWKTTDLYKASILSFIKGNAPEGILIIPSNFFVDADSKLREFIFARWEISQVTLYDSQVFEDTDVRVCTFYFKKGITTEILGYKIINGNIGKDWIEYLNTPSKYKVSRLRIGDKPNTSLLLKATDTGSKGGEICLTKGIHYYGKITDRNLATIVLNVPLTASQEYKVINLFNSKLNAYREQYNSMFLTNFLAGKDGVMRKRISFRDGYKLIDKILQEVLT